MLSSYIIHRLTAEREIPKIEVKKCMHRTRFLLCKTCATICPSKAITFKKNADKTATVLKRRCKSCGICAAGCPSRCISLPGVNWENIFVRAVSRKKLILGCNRWSSIFPGSEPISICAGALTAEFIAVLTIARQFLPFAIDISKCRTCMPKATWSLFRNLRKAKVILAPQQLPVTLLFQPEKEGPCSRRDAFHYLGSQLHQLADGLLESKNVHPENLHRSLLLNALEQDPGVSVILESWEINSSCRACGRCQNICPQQAWSIERKPDSVLFFHTMTKCFGCNLCSLACPADAKEKIFLPYSRGGNTRHQKIQVRTFKALRCQSCNRQVVQLPESGVRETRCMICQKRKALSPCGF